MSACRSCGAELVWGRTRDGKAMPLDAVPNPDGNVEARPPKNNEGFSNNGVLRVVAVHPGPPMFLDPACQVFMPHFATCPNWV